MANYREEVWAEEGGIRVAVEHMAAGVKFTIHTTAGAVSATVAHYRIPRLLAVAGLPSASEAQADASVSTVSDVEDKR